MAYLRHPFSDLPHSAMPGESDDINFHAVASAEDASFLDVRIRTKLGDSTGPFCLRHSELLTHLNRSCVNAQANDQNAALFARVSCIDET